MLKKLLLALLIALPLSAAAQKFGVVRIDEVITSLPDFNEMRKQITESSQKYEAEFQKLQEQLQKLYTDYQAIQNDPATPEGIKERRMQDIQDTGAKVEQFRQTASQDLERQQQQLLAPIRQRVNEAVQSVGKEGGYTFIFPYEPEFLLYQGSEVTDVTATVKTKLGLDATAAPAAK